MPLEQHGGERRRKRQRVDRGDDRRDGDGYRELAIKLAGHTAEEGHRHEYRRQHQTDGDDRSAHLTHCLMRGGARRSAAGYVSLDVFHYHDGVVNHDTDREHHSEECQRVDRETEQQQDRKRADDRDRHRDKRDNRGAPGLQEQHDHHDHQHHRLEQGLDHRLDGASHEDGRVVDHLPGDVSREALGELGHLGTHLVRDLDRVCPRCLQDGDRHRGFVVEQGAQCVVGGAELDARHVLEARQLTLSPRPDDDVAELLHRREAPLGIDRQRKRRCDVLRRRPDLAGGNLDVLIADRIDDVARGQSA